MARHQPFLRGKTVDGIRVVLTHADKFQHSRLSSRSLREERHVQNGSSFVSGVLDDISANPMTSARLGPSSTLSPSAIIPPDFKPFNNIDDNYNNSNNDSTGFQYTRVDTIVTCVLVVLIILLSINLAVLMYKPIRRYVRRRYRNLDHVQKKRKERRYQTIDQWLVTKTVQPHDAVCEAIQQLTTTIGNTNVNDCTAKYTSQDGTIGSFVEVILKVTDRESSCPYIATSENPNRLLNNVHLLCDKIEVSCRTCQLHRQSNDNSNDKKAKQKSSSSSQETSESSCSNSINSDLDSDEERLCCSICLERFVAGDKVSWSPSPKCCHVYHHACIRDWLLRKTGCPYCRETVLPVDRALVSAQDSSTSTVTTATNSVTDGSTTATNTAVTDTAPDRFRFTRSTGRKTVQRKACPTPTSDLSMEQRHRFRTTYFCVDCGLVCLSADRTNEEDEEKSDNPS
ncbi:ring finger domain containing protein [Nitzschia inconspicua]|uniref:Ring finger domain containing protein n=1 Tax=Nitzschia inconspicua TaxID=303405 RepID=A0A9K3KDG8_9STRA|nr:ring finger domain containing protein [Nitzschia inconspicua]KAG7367810.1 ring finger domain containing protein [Nitzschia inconspicua]